MPKPIVIAASRLSPLQIETQFFAVLVEPVDARARARLIEAEYGLFTPALLHLAAPAASKRDFKLHKRAVRIIQQERLLAAEYARAHIAQAIVHESGGEGVKLQAEGDSLGPLTMENFGLWALREQRRLGGRDDNPNKVTWKYFQQQAWRNSKPVLHLALVVHEMTRNCSAVNKPYGAAALSEAFADPLATQQLFDIAEQHRATLLKIAGTGAFLLDESESVQLIAA